MEQAKRYFVFKLSFRNKAVKYTKNYYSYRAFCFEWYPAFIVLNCYFSNRGYICLFIRTATTCMKINSQSESKDMQEVLAAAIPTAETSYFQPLKNTGYNQK